MKKAALLIAFLFSCHDRDPVWYGIPDNRQCSNFAEDKTAICNAGKTTYVCIANEVSSCNGPLDEVYCNPANASSRAVRQRHTTEQKNNDDAAWLMMMMTP